MLFLKIDDKYKKHTYCVLKWSGKDESGFNWFRKYGITDGGKYDKSGS